MKLATKLFIIWLFVMIAYMLTGAIGGSLLAVLIMYDQIKKLGGC